MLSSVLIAGLVAVSSVFARALPPRATTFGSCGSPAIIFANGLDGRTEAAFAPANKADFSHGSANAIGIITSFICQQLNDKCKASADQIAACNAGATAASKVTGQPAADAFNAALGVTAASSSPPADPASPAVAAPPATDPAAGSTTPAANTGALNFGKCTDPTVIFGAGLDGRKATELSFIPKDQTQFKHSSALNPDIIYQFTCDNLVNTCGLKQTDTAVTTCRAAQKTAVAVGRTGASADKFNELLGFTTNFAALDSAAPTADPAGNAPVLVATPTDSVCSPATTTVTVTATSTPVASTTTATAAATTTAVVDTTGSNASSVVNTGSLDFGTCTDPTVIFGAGLDGRKDTEFSFLPHDQTQFAHNSALNPDIVYQFMCDNLVNKCGLKQTDTAVTTCRAAQKTAVAVGRTGASADKFNELLGFTTNFAALDANLPAPSAGKRSVPASMKGKRDPRLALKEMTDMAKKRGYSAARNVRVADWE